MGVTVLELGFGIPIVTDSPVYNGFQSPGARFSKVPVPFRARNQIFKSKYKKKRALLLASKLLHFVSLTDSFIMLDAKLLKPRSLM